MRINRNRRRSARPVFSSVNSSRRRAMARRRMLNSNRQRLNCAAEIGDIVTFNELNEAQKQSAIRNIWNTVGAEWVYEAFNESVMEMCHEDVQQLAKECEAKVAEICKGTENADAFWEIDTDKLYWEENSQGPYPTWRLNEVIGGISFEYLNPAHIVSNQTPASNDKPAVEMIEIEYDYYSDNQDAADCTVNIEYFDPDEEDWFHDYGIDPADPTYAVPVEVQNKIKAFVEVIQYFLDTVWGYVRNVCWETPDDAYAYDLYEANDWGDFEIIDEETAEYYNDRPVW